MEKIRAFSIDPIRFFFFFWGQIMKKKRKFKENVISRFVRLVLLPFLPSHFLPRALLTMICIFFQHLPPSRLKKKILYGWFKTRIFFFYFFLTKKRKDCPGAKEDWGRGDKTVRFKDGSWWIKRKRLQWRTQDWVKRRGQIWEFISFKKTRA